MTDIDALIAEARELFLIGIAPGGEETMAGRLLDALTVERAKVAALEAENAKFRTMLGGSTALAEGLGIRTDAIMQEVALAAYKQLEEAKAQAARWREVAGELAGALEMAMTDLVTLPAQWKFIRAALARFKQESGQ